ncbi:MAG: methylenetetrahydrofolate reductase [NAD(P)H] [Deltaproteobacteria bacterium]
MKIKELFDRGNPVFSFEFFPPKDEAGITSLMETVKNLQDLHPSFVSVTYGAGGSTRRKTIEITKRIKQELGIEAMSHLTCVGHSRDEISAILDEIETAGIENIMTLRGDPPRGEAHFVPHPDGFGHANELVTFIRSQKPAFCLGVAGYPEGHPEAPSKEADLANLKRKVDAGANFIVTQLFFDTRDYFDLTERAQAVGIRLPVVPGIMPITDVAQIKRFTQMCGAKIPPALLAELETVDGNKEGVVEIGIRYSTAQCESLLKNGAPGIHFYTLNKSTSTRTILSNLKNRLLIPD